MGIRIVGESGARVRTNLLVVLVRVIVDLQRLIVPGLGLREVGAGFARCHQTCIILTRPAVPAQAGPRGPDGAVKPQEPLSPPLAPHVHLAGSGKRRRT